MSHVERAVTCLHCRKVHNRGFIWNFSATVRVCFTCYRVMGEDGRKSYERDAARAAVKQSRLQAGGSKGWEYTGKVMAVLALLTALLATGACFLYEIAPKARGNFHSASSSETLSPSPRHS